MRRLALIMPLAVACHFNAVVECLDCTRDAGRAGGSGGGTAGGGTAGGGTAGGGIAGGGTAGGGAVINDAGTDAGACVPDAGWCIPDPSAAKRCADLEPIGCGMTYWLAGDDAHVAWTT